MALRYLTIKKFASESGYTEHAIYTKISRGIWPEGSVWLTAPDGRKLIDVLGYEAWVAGGLSRPGPVSSKTRTE